jgi:predicted GIY-YIG superfamily endonuclease
MVKRYIYCTSSEYATFYKIGITKNLQQRIRDANTCKHAWAIQDWKYEFVIEVETDYDGGNNYEREITMHDTLVAMGAKRIGIKEQFANISLEKIRLLFKTMSTTFVDPLNAPVLEDVVVEEEEEEEEESETEPEQDITKTDVANLLQYLQDGQSFYVKTEFETTRPSEIVNVVFHVAPDRKYGWEVEFPDGKRCTAPTEVQRYARSLTGASEDELEKMGHDSKKRMFIDRDGACIFTLIKNKRKELNR